MLMLYDEIETHNQSEHIWVYNRLLHNVIWYALASSKHITKECNFWKATLNCRGPVIYWYPVVQDTVGGEICEFTKFLGTLNGNCTENRNLSYTCKTLSL